MAKFSAILFGVLISQLTSRGIIADTEETKGLNHLRCGNRTSLKNSIIIERNQTDAKSGTNCVYHIDSYSPDVRQLFIQFRFNLTPPAIPSDSSYFVSECKSDYLEIGGNRYCGSEDFQHIYVPFDHSAGVTSIEIRFVLAPCLPGAVLVSEPYLVVIIEQLEASRGLCSEETNLCPGSNTRPAPPGCLQYFPKEEDAITSFNYRDGLGLYPAGLNYTICIRHPPGAWTLRLAFLDFNLRGYVNNTESVLEVAHADYLSIPRSIVDPVRAADFWNVQTNSFYGSSIQNKTVISEGSSILDDTTFRMHFVSNFAAQNESRAGFLLKYKVLYEKDVNDIYTKV